MCVKKNSLIIVRSPILIQKLLSPSLLIDLAGIVAGNDCVNK